MEDLYRISSELQQTLNRLTYPGEKELFIFRHILDAVKINHVVEDFPSGLDWFNTSEPLTRTHLRGKIVVLDFFTYCCINCLHVIPRLKLVERAFPHSVVVIGVHSAKFDHEKDSKNICLALKKYNITHPVINDKNCYMWNKLDISCWPTIVILSPSSQLLAVFIGEGNKNLFLFVEFAFDYFKHSISMSPLPVLALDQIVTSGVLSFPGKITRWKKIYAVSDSGNHRIIIFEEGDNCIKLTVGGKKPGFEDGSFESALFNSPQGLAFYDSSKIYVADTVNHAIRLINLESRSVTTVVGNGRRGVDYKGGRLGTFQEISSPWDVCIVPCSDVEVPATGGLPSLGIFSPPGKIPPPPAWPCKPPPPPPPPSVFPSRISPSGDFSQPPSLGQENSAKVLLIAAAGTHQIWAYFIDSGVWWKGKKYDRGVCVAVAGSGKEENRNNCYPMQASFAQPSGLTYSKELKSVFIADSESSSIRKLSLKDGNVSHVAGGARSPNDLFSYGDVDGKAYEAKLQHPLAVVWSARNNSVFVCDTYNHKIKRIDVSSGLCKSLHESGDVLSEPGGACMNEFEDVIYVCDTNNNCVKTLRISDGSLKTLVIREESETEVDKPTKDVHERREAETSLSKRGGTLTLKIKFSPEEIHGKWRLKSDESKITGVGQEGKLTGSDAEFFLEARPSTVDDVFEIFLDLVLCGSDTCSFHKKILRVHVKRVEDGEMSALCELRWDLI